MRENINMRRERYSFLFDKNDIEKKLQKTSFPPLLIKSKEWISY